MRILALFLGVGVCLAMTTWLPAQDPPEKERTYCDVSDPKSNCPGADCLCVEETLEVTFDGVSDSVLEINSFTEHMPVRTFVVMDVKTVGDPGGADGVVGWAFGVQHDGAFLTLTQVTFAGTDAERAEESGFVFISMSDIETCDRKTDSTPTCENAQPGTGYTTAVVLARRVPDELAGGRNTLVKADYTLNKDPGSTGTLIQIVNNLKTKGGPPVDINISIYGKTRAPLKLVDGWVKTKGTVVEGGRFLRGDANDDGRLNITDPIWILNELFHQGSATRCQDAADTNDDGTENLTDIVYIFNWAFRGGPTLPPPFPDCGRDMQGDNLTCLEDSTGCAGPPPRQG